MVVYTKKLFSVDSYMYCNTEGRIYLFIKHKYRNNTYNHADEKHCNESKYGGEFHVDFVELSSYQRTVQ